MEKQDGFLEYIELGESKVVLPIGDDDGHFGPIAIPNVPFGDATHTTLYVRMCVPWLHILCYAHYIM